MTQTPKHVAIIMDGNGRWAEQRKWPRALGHRAGAKAVRKAVEYAYQQKISVLSLFALSIENHLHRPKSEVEYLFKLFLEFLQANLKELTEKNVRIEIVGERKNLRPDLIRAMIRAETKTAQNTGLRLVIAFNYSGRWDIVHAAQQIVRQAARGELDPENIGETDLTQHLQLTHLPEPDLLIRTGGEQRISNFMLWQLAYAELYFTDIFWPDFNATTFAAALTWY
nr:di-trans,poly-cis-decaprenylcistransferase [Gammaproteobacteria bacterium]